jgi:hypothetical protein
MARKESAELATQWFSKYLKVVISDREAREFVAQLPNAIKDLRQLKAIVADEKWSLSRIRQN